MKDDRLPKIVFFGQPSRANQRAGVLWLWWKDVVKKDLRGMGTSWEGVKREVLNELGWRVCIALLALGKIRFIAEKRLSQARNGRIRT
jgi:hypothetical protein